MEDYVVAVLGGEMPVSFPMEALKAQAVAARTYALQRKIEALGQPVHLGSSVLAQVYGGVNRENSRTRAAAAATAGRSSPSSSRPSRPTSTPPAKEAPRPGSTRSAATSPTSRA
jgi:hypothetical protein